MNPVFRIKNGTKQGYLDAFLYDGIDLNYPDSSTRRARVMPQMAHTLTGGDNEYVVVPCLEENYE